MSTDKFKNQVQFILRFGKALHAAGAPAHTLEATMLELCELIGIQGSFVSQPTAILSSFTNGDEEITKIDRVGPAGVNLGKLSELDLVARLVIKNEMSYEQARIRLDEILASTSPFNKLTNLIFYTYSAMGFMLLFGGNWIDLLAAMIVGFFMGLLAMPKTEGLVGQLSDATAAVVASFLTYLLVKLFPQINSPVVIISGLIIFLPGLFITIAIAEIATNNLVSGTARLMGGVMVLLKLTFGVFIGSKIASWIHLPVVDLDFASIPTWFGYITLPLTAFMSVINFKASRIDWKWVGLSGIFGYLCSKLGSHYLGPELGMFFGGVCVGAMSNLFARLMDRPSAIFQWPGIILIVPGSVGYRSVTSLFQRDVVGGIDTAFSMITLALALVVGVFLGNIIIRPRSYSRK